MKYCLFLLSITACVLSQEEKQKKAWMKKHARSYKMKKLKKRRPVRKIASIFLRGILFLWGLNLGYREFVWCRLSCIRPKRYKDDILNLSEYNFMVDKLGFMGICNCKGVFSATKAKAAMCRTEFQQETMKKTKQRYDDFMRFSPNGLCKELYDKNPSAEKQKEIKEKLLQELNKPEYIDKVNADIKEKVQDLSDFEAKIKEIGIRIEHGENLVNELIKNEVSERERLAKSV